MGAELYLRSQAATLLHSAETGDPEALERLVPLLYDELRRMAHRELARESGTPTLHTTELVHEAYLRLLDGGSVSVRGRSYFFGAAARAMRRVLIDAARKRTATKRGGGEIQVTLEDDAVADSSTSTYALELLDLNRALTRLEEQHPRLARVVELRYFGGLSVEETAAVLHVSPRTVTADWALARAWLHTCLSDELPKNVL
jgi:RNA polymerase sigma-70 factor, ECF subfamily